MNPRMVPWSGQFVLMGAWNRLILWMTVGVLSGWQMMSKANGCSWSAICSRQSWLVSIEFGHRSMLYVRSASLLFARVGSPFMVAARGPCSGLFGGGGKFAALVAWLLPAIAIGSSLTLASSNLSAATVRLSRLNWMNDMVVLLLFSLILI